MRRKYGFWNLVLDCVLTLVTGGIWLIWVLAREIVYLAKKK